jgi:hypothetical protein
VTFGPAAVSAPRQWPVSGVGRSDWVEIEVVEGLAHQWHAPQVLAREKVSAVGAADWFLEQARHWRCGQDIGVYCGVCPFRWCVAVGVTQIEPCRSGIDEDSAELDEDRAEGVDVVLECGFQPVLAVVADRAAALAAVRVSAVVGGCDSGMCTAWIAAGPGGGAIVAQFSVGRGGNNAVHRVVGEFAEDVEGVTGVQGEVGIGVVGRFQSWVLSVPR